MTQALSHQWIWKAYSVLVVVIQLTTIVLGGLTISNVITSAVSSALCVPLVGYSWQRPLGARWLGKAAFLFGIVLAPFALAFGTYTMGIAGAVATLAILLFYIPFCYASFHFGYRAEHLWSAPPISE